MEFIKLMGIQKTNFIEQNFRTKFIQFGCILYKGGEKIMGNIIKINMYVENRKKMNNTLELKNVEEEILRYNDWLRRTNREDKIENYEKFLQER